VRDLSFRWQPGDVLVLSGPNGSGKSTTLRLLLGLARPMSGHIRVGGVDLTTTDGGAWRSRIAYLAQRPFFSERATVREAMRFLAPDATDDRCRVALERVGVLSGLEERGAPLDVRVGSLSVGQRQRVALARVLVKDAPILVLDEPDANLDHAGIQAVVRIVKELAPKKMIAVVAHTDDLVALPGTHLALNSAEEILRISAPAPAPRPVGTVR
jgi:ABC-type transport system involved in cytochrome bd biosynthesis fused ATPase/permease subunit